MRAFEHINDQKRRFAGLIFIVSILILTVFFFKYITFTIASENDAAEEFFGEAYRLTHQKAMASDYINGEHTAVNRCPENSGVAKRGSRQNSIEAAQLSDYESHNVNQKLISIEEIPGIDHAIVLLEQKMLARGDKPAPLYLDAVSDEIPAEIATLIEEKPTEDYSNYDKDTALFLKQIDSIAAAARWETNRQEIIYLSALTENDRKEKLTALPYQQNETRIGSDRRTALTSSANGPRLQKENIETQAFHREMHTQVTTKYGIAEEACSPALLSYYSIRNGYVRRGVPDTTNNTARLTSSIRSHFFNVRFNAFYSAHSRDFHTDNLKFQRTITTGGIHRAVELCPFEKRRV